MRIPCKVGRVRFLMGAVNKQPCGPWQQAILATIHSMQFMAGENLGEVGIRSNKYEGSSALPFHNWVDLAPQRTRVLASG